MDVVECAFPENALKKMRSRLIFLTAGMIIGCFYIFFFALSMVIVLAILFSLGIPAAILFLLHRQLKANFTKRIRYYDQGFEYYFQGTRKRYLWSDILKIEESDDPDFSYPQLWTVYTADGLNFAVSIDMVNIRSFINEAKARLSSPIKL